MGKLIVIEGLDGSGKSTQLELLNKNLKAQNIDCKAVSFPDYDSPSSTLVKMYLAGDFGKKPDDVNAFAASVFSFLRLILFHLECPDIYFKSFLKI